MSRAVRHVVASQTLFTNRQQSLEVGVADPAVVVRLLGTSLCLSSSFLSRRRRLRRPSLCLILELFEFSRLTLRFEKDRGNKTSLFMTKIKRKKIKTFWRAALAGVAMPTSANPILLTRTPPLQLLCYLKSVGQRGSCRLCVLVSAMTHASH